ncbi:VOC family protein [Lysobacter sp. HA35]
MIAYTTIGTNDLPRAAAYYDTLLALIGGKREMEQPGYFIAYGTGGHGAGLGVTVPFDKNAATVGNGVMVALEAKDRAQVDAVHAKALELGGTDEGAPGERFPGFYAGYFRDLDGNKLNICHMTFDQSDHAPAA